MSEMKKNQSSTEKKATAAPAQQSTESKPLDKKIHDMIGPIFQQLGVENGIVIAQPSDSEEVAIYYRGHFYDVATLVAEIHRKFKTKIVQEIGGD